MYKKIKLRKEKKRKKSSTTIQETNSLLIEGTFVEVFTFWWIRNSQRYSTWFQERLHHVDLGFLDLDHAMIRKAFYPKWRL